MQHLGGTQAVENIDAGVLKPAPADIGRQRFSRRSATTQVEFLPFRQLGTCQEGTVKRRHAVENCRPVLTQNAANRSWSRAFAEKNGGCADRKRKTERIAEPIGEEELSCGKDDIAFLNAENRLAVELGS